MPNRAPDFYVADFAKFSAKMGVPLTDGARQLIRSVEQRAFELDRVPNEPIMLAAMIRCIPELRATLLRYGLDPDAALASVERHIERDKDDGYASINSDRYSTQETGQRSSVGSIATAGARFLGKKVTSEIDLLGALLDIHDAVLAPGSNSEWFDTGLHVTFNTLSHILGKFDAAVWIPFDVIRRDLGLLPPGTMRRRSIDSAPPHIRTGLSSFFAAHPDYRRNCFLIMPLRESASLRAIHRTLRDSLKAGGFNLLRADEQVFSESLFTNIEVFMYGCHFAVSVLERMETEQHNANVALEVGYMLGLKKDVCLLKERTVKALPSDLQGRLYVEFDASSIETTIRSSVDRWIQHRGLTADETKRPADTLRYGLDVPPVSREHRVARQRR